MIPWDLDNSFVGAILGSFPWWSNPGPYEYDPYSMGEDHNNNGFLDIWEERPLVYKLLNDSHYRKIYTAHLRTIIEESLDTAMIRQNINNLQTLAYNAAAQDNNKVFYSNGQEKINNNIWAAVFDYDLGTHKYHQCADAAIYLNAMYKYENGYKNQLIYSFTNGDKSSYKDWLNGAQYNLDPNNIRVLNKTFKSKREDNLITFYNWLKMLWT